MKVKEVIIVKEETKSLAVYIGAGILAGAISFVLKNNLFSLVLALAVFSASSIILQRIVKKQVKWLLSNGGYLYFFVWFIFWVILYNL